ncbi:MAG: D-aminoacyl-tRNA deacylase [Pseudohongiellaceae bacterium]
MIALLQRVSHARLRIDGEEYSRIGPGIVIFLGLERDDDAGDGRRLLQRVLDYRIFPDDEGRMNCNVADVEGEILLVSQFTLAADTRRGLRPGFSTAMPPEPAEALYDELVEWLRGVYPRVAMGRFGAHMKVALENDGPVTFTLRT